MALTFIKYIPLVLIWIGFYIPLFIILNKYIKIREIRKNKEITNKTYELYSKLDPKLMDSELDEWIKKYINRYMIKNFIVQNIDYIKKDQIDEMVRDITKELMIDISDLYLFYIKLLVNIQNDDDLLQFIYYKASDRILEVVTEYNTPK